MFTDNAEAAYFQQRIDVSRDMALAATNDCARIVHEALFDHYRRKLADLPRAPSPLRSVPIKARFGAKEVIVES